MESITLLNSLPFFVSVFFWSALILAVLIAGFHAYYGITHICLKLKFGILLLLGKAKSWTQRCLLRQPTTRYDYPQEQPSFATLTLSDLSPESNPALPLSKKEKQSFQKKNARKQKRDQFGRFLKG
jgi:hypothetical protein